MEATTAAAFPSPFLLYLLCSRGEARGARRHGDEGEERHFSQSRVLSTVISTKIRQRLAIVPNRARLHTRAQILPRFFPGLCAERRGEEWSGEERRGEKGGVNEERMPACTVRALGFYALVCRCRVLFTKCK